MPIDRQQLAARLRTLPLISNHALAEDEDGAPLPDPFIAITEAERDALLAALGAEAEPRGWQPISTAPKDGQEIVGWFSDCAIVVSRYGSMWREDRHGPARYPSHWMPLPTPPSSGREEQA